MAEATTTYGPKDKKPKWQVKPFNFSAVKKIGQDKTTTRTEPKVVRTEVKREDPIVNDPVPVTDDPKLGMGDLKQAEAESNVNFFDQPRPRNINDLYQTPQDNTRAPVYDYKKLEDKPITKKVYKERINNPENREPTFPISQPIETESGSYEAKDIEPELQAQELIQKTEILNKINSGEINLPPFVSSLPVDMQLSYVGATYNNNPLYTSLSTLMEPLLHLDNLVRSGMNKAFSTDYKMLTPPNMSGEDEDDKLITGGTELLTALIPLGASIKGANYLLQGIKNPFIKKILGTGLGFVINTQPALLDNLQQGKMELKDYAAQTATDFVTGLTFGAMPHGTPLKYDLPYQTIVPTMVPVISDLVMGKEVNEKDLINGFLSNMVLSLVMSGQLPKNTKVKEVTRQVETELNKYDESQKTPELVNEIIAGLLPPAREQNAETISRVKPGETKQVPKDKSTLDKLLRRDPGTETVTTKPAIEQVTVPGDRSRIVVDESGTAKVEPEAEQQGYIAPIKLTAEQYADMKRNGLTAEQIQEAQDNLNNVKPIYKKTENVQTESVRTEDGQDNRITPEAKPEAEPVKQEPEREYKTVTIEREEFGKKFVIDSKGNKFIVKAEKDNRGIEFYHIYRKGPSDPAPVKLGKYLGRAAVNIGLRAHAEGDMRLADRPKLKQETAEVKKTVSDQEKKYTKAYDDILDLRDEVNNVKSSDLSGRANKSKNIALLKKAVDIYNANHPDNNAKIERTKYGTYNITINGKPLRRESVKREFDPETEASNINNPNATKSFKELGAEEREVQRKIAENIIETGPALVKEKAKFETPVKVLRKGLEDIREDSGKEQSAEAKIVREEMLEKTDNGAEYRTKKEDGQDNGIKEPERRNIFEKMTLPQIENHIESRVKEFKSRVDYLQSAEYKEIIKPIHDKLLNRQIADVKKQVEYEKEKLKNKVITKEQYDAAIRSIKERGKNMYSNPIDPAALKDIMVVGLYHFEQGARSLASWSKKMVKELGDKVKPYLKEVYKIINNENKDRVFHGTEDLGENPILKRDVKGNSIIPEAVFVTHSLSYAERYKSNKVDDNHKLIPGKIYETKISKDKEIFDATKPKHLDRLLDGFKRKMEDGEYDSMENVMHDYNYARKYISESINKGALDWGVGTEYLDVIEKAGFKGAKLLERPADNITVNDDGSFDLKGDPIYSYALFKDTPVKNANTVSRESYSKSIENINDPKRNKLSHNIPWDTDYNTTLDNMDKNVPKDFYTNPEYYAYFKDKADRESWAVIKNVKGKPEAEVTIYRAVPEGIKDILPGDWVSLSKTYAKDHGKHHEDKSLDMPVISKKVKVKEVIWDNNSINEFAYYPEQAQKILSSDSFKKAVQELRKLPDKASALPLDYYAKNAKNLTIVGIHYLESGLTKFGVWAKRMVKELGDKIKPHLKKIWAEINKDRTGLKNVVTQGYAGRQALGYEKAKEEGKVFKNPYDKKERFEIDDSKAKLKEINPGKIELSNTAKFWDDGKVYDFSKVMIKGDRIYDAKNAYVDNFNEDFKNTYSNPFNSMEDMIDFYKNKEYREAGTLKGILDHPELYRNYPEAGKIKIEIDDSEDWTGKALGNYNPKTNTITLSSDILKHTNRLKSVLLHEIQHAIQQGEGFAKGGNANMFNDVNTKYKLLSKLKDVASSLFDQLPEDLKNDARKVNREDDTDGTSLTKIQNNPDAKAIWADYLNARKQIEEIDNTPDNKFSIETARDQYKKLAGEIESRDVQARMNLTKEQRDPNSPEYVAPYSSENISPDDAIVMYDGTESMSSMKLKDKDGEPETFEQYKKRIAKEYGTVPSREEYNDAKKLQVTSDKLQENKVKTELEGVLNDVVNAPAKQKTLDELRSRTSKSKKNAPANEVYMDKVYAKMNEIQADMEKRGYKGQSLMNQSEIQSIKHLFSNDPEFKKFKAEQKRAIVREVKNYYKEEYRKRTAANAVLGEEYTDKNWWQNLKNSSFLQSRNHLARQGPSGKEMAERFKHMADQERELMGEPSGLLLDIEGLSKAEKNNLEKIWEQKMNEQIPMNYLNDNVKNLDAKIDDYFENMANMYKERGFVTRNLLTGDVYAFTPKRDYRPRIMNDKVSELEVKEDSSGIPKENKSREKVIDFLIETKQAKDRAGAAILLDNELSKHRIRKAGNVEYSRNEKLRLPDEYYVKNPTESLLAYAKKVSKRVSFVDAWGMEGQIFNRLRDDLYKEGKDYKRANDLFRYETGQLTAKERQAIYDVNNVKAFMALTKFSPFTSLRNAFQGFLGTTTRGNLKAGFSGLVKSLDPVMKKHAYEAGVMADNLEGIFKDTIGANNNNFLGNLTTKYLDLIKFTATDRYNRVISAVGGLSFMEDMLKRIKKDSVWKKRAAREFKKLEIDPDKVIENGGFTKAEKDKIMRTFAFDSQFSLRPQDLPLWWSSPQGKLVTQWKPWGYKMTQLIRDNVIAEVKHGNVMPLVTMMTAYGVTGEAVNYLIDNIRSVANFNPKEDDKKNETPDEKSFIGKINQGDIGGAFERAVSDLAGLGALSLYWDIIRSFGYGKVGEGLSVLAGPAYAEAGGIIENVLGPGLKKLSFKSNDDWEEVTKKTIKGLYKSTAGNVPGAGTFRTFGMTKAFEDFLFKNDGPEFKDDSIIGEYYKGLDDPGKEEVKKIKEMEKDLKTFREKVLSNPTKEMQREFQRKESEIKRYKDKSRVWYNYTKLKSTKEKEESKKLGK